MEATSSRLEWLKDCTCMHSLSLFPGSFDKHAANAIITTSNTEKQECNLEAYVRHSLLEEYFVSRQRYKMHRLIREYLKQKVLISDKNVFARKLRAHFVNILLKYSTKQEFDSIEMQMIASEAHNFHYLKSMLMNANHMSAEELAALAFLTDVQPIVKIKELLKFYPTYTMKVNDICPLLNPDLCRKLYLHTVKYLYKQCKCETLSEYLQNFFNSTCMEYFQCTTINTLNQILKQSISTAFEGEKQFLDRVANYHCSEIFQRNLMINVIISITLGRYIEGTYNPFTQKRMLNIITLLIVVMITWTVNLIKNNKTIFADKIVQPLLIIIETVAKEICYSTVYLFIVTLIVLPIIIIVNIKVYMHDHERTSGKYFPLWFMIITFITIITIAFIIYYKNVMLLYFSSCQFIPICF